MAALPLLGRHTEAEWHRGTAPKPGTKGHQDVPLAAKQGALCCTAFSSSKRRSSSDRLQPSTEVMAAEAESEDLSLFGKLQERPASVAPESFSK